MKYFKLIINLHIKNFLKRITSEGVETIVNGINDNSTLEIINLSKNLIDVDYFGDTLKQFSICF